MMFSSQTEFGVLLKEFRTKVNLKGVKLNTNIGHKAAQKQQKVYVSFELRCGRVWRIVIERLPLNRP